MADLRTIAIPFAGAPQDYDPLLEAAADAKFVLLGEASHGTHEFYRERAAITKRLIREAGFTAVAVEASWPEANRVNRYLRGEAGDAAAIDSFAEFDRFPIWMWRNADVLDFAGWLRDHNDSLPDPSAKAGFYGLDLYSLHSSIRSVLRYLDKTDADAARRARYRYACFDHFGEDTQAYGHAASFGFGKSCENEVVEQLVELQRRAVDLAAHDGHVARDEFLYAEQNARLVKNAEQYYRSMFTGRVSSWNLRDRHMAETLDALAAHLDRDAPAKIVVWAHNSHLGDARATEMSPQGELNLGQLVREKYGTAALLVGFSTYTGTVTAASAWDEPAARKRVRPALPGSFEALFHRTGLPAFMLDLRDRGRLPDELLHPWLQRAIGVIYRPDTERISHYFHAELPKQFDFMLHFDETRAVEPLEPSEQWHRGEETPETYPYAV